MKNNQNEPKQLDCQLKCRATAELEQDIIKDNACMDKCLGILLGKDDDEFKPKDTNNNRD